MTNEAKFPRHAPAPGFTLVEILAVLVIIGIAIGLIRVNFTPHPAKTLEEEARRLALLFEQARDDAMTSGCTIAWKRQGESRRLACVSGGAQTLAQGRDDRRPTMPWPPLIALERFSIAGVPAPRDSPLLFTPSGINAPFELVLALEGERVLLAGDLIGRVRVASAVTPDGRRP